MSAITNDRHTTGVVTDVDEDQALKIAQAWLETKIGRPFPVSGAFYKPAAQAGGPEGYYFDQPARWLIVFDAETPQGFHPEHIHLYVDAMTGEVEAASMM